MCTAALTRLKVGRYLHGLTSSVAHLQRYTGCFGSTVSVRYGETAEPLIQEFIERTPAVIDEVQWALPPWFSDEAAVKVLSGLRTAARVLEVMPAG